MKSERWCSNPDRSPRRLLWSGSMD